MASGPGQAIAEEDAAAAPRAQAEDRSLRVDRDAKTFQTTICIRADRGRVAWADVLRGLARARGYDDQALAGLLPQGAFELESAGWKWTSLGLNVALSPGVRFDVEKPDAGGDPWLAVSLNEKALLESQRRFQNRIREALVERRAKRGNYGLALDDGWDKAAADKLLVVSIHGLHSGPLALDKLLDMARQEGFPCGRFRYPNDQAIEDSGRLLARELKAVAEKAPRRGVALVTHSMGGLVARAAIEDPELDPGNVRRLIMFSPPNHGSLLAHFAYGLDVSEHLHDKDQRKDANLFYAMIEDGLSEAYTDLKPDSQFLAKLNARPRNGKVRYTILLGDRAPAGEDDVAALRRKLEDPQSRWVRFFGARLQPWLADLDEVIDGRGDGVVAVKRGRLAGVEDTHVLHFNHVNIVRGESDEVQKARRLALERLKSDKRTAAE